MPTTKNIPKNSTSSPTTPVNPAPAKNAPGLRGRSWILWLLVAAFVVAAIVVAYQRHAAGEKTEKTTEAAATPVVSIIQPKEKKADTELVLPGNVEPFADTPIFARTSGYVKRWLVNIGDTVKAGQLLAEIDSPEVDQQLQQARAALANAQANQQLAAITAERWKQMLARKTVSQQESDEKSGMLASQTSNENSAVANVRRLEEMKGFEQVTAPFDGRIIERRVNVGDLITAGSTGEQTELFRLAQDSTLRVFTHVPEVNASQITVGMPATIDLASSPQPAKGKVAHLAGAIDAATRTLLVEIQVDNSDHRLLAGGYATVHLPIHADHPALLVPVNVLLFRPDGTVIGVVGKNNVVKLEKVEIGRDLGTEVELKSGAKPTDRLIVNPSDALQEGDHVQVKEETQQKFPAKPKG